MRYLLIAISFLLLLRSNALAEVGLEKMLLIKFRTEPAHARVFLEGSASNVMKADKALSLGFADDGILLERSKHASGNLTLTFKAPGYQDFTSQFSLGNAFANQNKVEIPAIGQPPIKLVKLARDWLGLALASGATLIAVGLGIGGYLHFRASRTKVFDIKAWVSDNLVRATDGDYLLGQRLGSYWVIEKLGVGGMATVYRAVKEDDIEHEFALKVIHPHVADNPDFPPRFKREVSLGSKLHHRGVVNVEEAGVEGGRYFMALELVKGVDLRSKLPPQGFALFEALAYLVDIFEAVAYAHSLGIAHRDLKPENIMLTHDGVVKLADFGLARSHDLSTITATGSVMGTPSYMAPEQIMGQPLNLATDQYSLGVMSFELLTGRLPFVAEDVMAMISAHLQLTPPAPSSLKPGIPQGIDDLVLKMMAKEPEERFSSMQEALWVLKEQAKKYGA